VDETYVGGQWKNMRKTTRDTGTKRGRGTTKQPVFGILCRRGIVWAEVVDDVSAATLQPLIKNRVRRGQSFAVILGKATLALPPKGMCIGWLTTAKESTQEAKRTSTD